MCNIKFILIVQLLFSFCLCEISNGQQEKLLNGFLEYYNGLPDQVYHSQESSLINTQQEDDTTYRIEANVRVAEVNNAEARKWLKCTATIKDSENVVSVLNSNCEDVVVQQQSPAEKPETTLEAQVEVTEPIVERRPVQLDNEVQADTGITSGEQFIAVPRDQPSAPCVGCASHVNPQAAGVSELANLGVRHLDLHEPGVKHTLETVIDVERQVQVVNGVRYILTLSINSNNCTEEESENCASSQICKITILSKPWVKLSNGGNYKAILANNCTEEWLFGENGEVLPEPSTDDNPVKSNTAGEDDIQVKHNLDVQSEPNQEKTVTDEDLKKIQEQIISYAQFQEVTESDRQSFTTSPDPSEVSKQHVFKIESERHTENSIPVTESEKTVHQAFNINLDKKKAIDDMLDFFDFSGFKPKTENEDAVPRVRRSYDYDLQVLSLADDFHGIKNSIENARYMYELAQAMVDYLNEMDMEVKNRAVKNVIRAEEEKENLQRFVYIQARVTIPCDKVDCESRDVDTQICNGVLDCSNEKSPQILNTFCYNDNKESDYREDIREISLDDPVLRKMVEEAVKQIETESKSQYALRINKIVSAITQVTSGTLTKFSVIVENIKCNKSVSLPLRINCTVLEQLGTKICDVIVHERHWLKEKKISYTCTDRPTDMRISKSKKVSKNVTIDDPQIIEMLQEAIQYLESQSDKSNKQKIVNIKSISSQIIAGFLTKIEFVVGYTDCMDENYSRDQINKCELLKGEELRTCKAQIWDRSWIMDGRQIEVTCDDVSKNNEIVSRKKKRSIDVTGDKEQQSLRKESYLDYKKLANESLYKFMQSSSNHQHYEVVKVDKAKVQDASRKLIKIDFSISPTNCFIRNGILSSSECEIENPENILHCSSKILENNWMNKKQYFVKCKIKSQAQKNSNELKERNPSDSKYYQLAEQSLAKFLQDTGNPHHVIDRVEKVTTQLVSGLLTRIDFIVSPKNQSANDGKPVHCHSEILEKHWLGTKDFNVSCQMKNRKKIDAKQIDIHNPKYMQIAVQSLQKYIKNKPESNLLRVAFVDKVKVLGDTIKIRFIASHAEEGDGDTLCFAEVSGSRESKNHINVKCHLIGKIFREAEIIEDDPNYYKYVQLAEESLRYYLQKMNSSPFNLVSIESVIVQWDEGIKTLIDFNISPDSENSEVIQGKHCVAEILEQPWLNKKKTIQDVKCELEKDLYRTKRRISNIRVRRQIGGHSKIQLPGGLKEQDPTVPKYRALAEESLQKYVADSGIKEILTLAEVVKVTTQVVSGFITRIDFVVSGSSDSARVKCHSEVWEQSWLNKKEITVTCENDGHRSKRGLAGGQTEQDPTGPKYRALAEESLQKYVADSGIKEILTLAEVVKVTTQVVSGSMTRIDFVVSGSSDSARVKCHSEVWEQSWLNKKEITVTCENDGHRSKRGLAGGQTEQDPTGPKYRALAEESLQKYVADSGIKEILTLAEVVKVTTQVVSGSMTRIDFVVSGSSDSARVKCHSEVWEQSWLNKKEITVTCENDSQRSKREAVLGGLTEQDPSKPKYKALAEESLQKYVADSGIKEILTLAEVVKVTTQVVSGSMTRIDFVVSGSSDSARVKCHSVVWEQSWLNKKEITVTCENDSQRSKREAVLGGLTEQDPSKPKYKALAEESLQKYVADSGIKEILTLAEVVKVTTQVVSGSMTRIDFVVSGSSDSARVKCHSEVWEQSWLNKKEITVTCENDSQRSKREAVLGGLTEQDPSKPKYKALAEESLQKYVADSGIKEILTLAEVVKVTTQVVSGSMTRIDFVVSGSSDSARVKCHSEVWEQSWLNKKEITVTCENDGHRSKRGLAGGQTEQDPTGPKYRALAEESLQKYVADSGIKEILTLAEVVKVTTQVVSGSMTRIDFVVSGSSDSARVKCHSEVWEQSWLNKKEITVTCENDGHRSKRGLAGGQTEQDPTGPKYRALAEESLQKYVADSGIKEILTLAEVVKVTTQVVSGSMTRIDFVVSGSSDSARVKCHSEVWEQSWLNKKEITVTCENDSQRSKREAVLGGLTEQDPSKPKYKALAEESLQKYVADSGIKEILTLAEVVKVTTQVVSGSMTRIDFVVSGSSDSARVKCHSEVWEQSWLNKKEITVTCENDGHRSKRGLAGGQTEQDPTGPKYRALAEESLQKYVADSGIKEILTLAEVVKVTTQVVSGSMTRIDFVVSGSSDSARVKCHSEVWEQSWLNKKEITVTCENDSQRSKREAVLGGLTEQDPSKPKYKALAEESLQKYVADSGIKEILTLAEVVKVTTQVVSGSMTRIDFVVSGSSDSARVKCHSEVWEQSWLNKKEITVTCENDGHRSKRGLAGGQTEQDPTGPKYRALAEESLQKYVADSGIKEILTLAEVVKVTTQVVSGSMTRIDFVVSGSSDSARVKCHSEVWEQSWLNKKEITVTCENDGHRSKRGLAGGQTEQDPTGPKYRALAEESLQKYVADSGIKEILTLAEVVKVTTQVVSGSMTRIDFVVSGSSDSARVKCHSEVWEQSWLNKKEITVTCENDGHRSKRGLAGGQTEQDPTGPKYRALAEESLQKYVADSGIKEILTLAEVVKVTTQVVSGSMTRIDFVVSGSSDSARVKCHSEVWEQAWLNKKEITVSCDPVNERVKRDLRMPGVWIRGNSVSKNDSQPVRNLRGKNEEEQEPNKPEYKQMAEESLRKLYRKKSTVYHKVIEVQHVTTRVVAGIKYKIDFTAAPTSCSVNVSSVRARSCKADDDVILYCHSDIWDRPWLRQKKIDVQCNNPTDDNDDLAEYDNDNHNDNNENYVKLAEEASEKYLTTSNRKYVHKVTEILSASEQVTNGTLTTINYSLSPTTCLRNETTDNTTCKLKKPLVVFTCNANIRIPSELDVEKEITVTCKKNSESKKRKRELVARKIRQTADDDDEIDEDTIYYYADRAVQHINDRSSSNNLHKLISIHAVQNSVQMGTLTIKMYIEVAETFCLRHHKSKDLRDCEEMSGLNHRLCLARLWPSPDDELVVRHVSVVCDDEEDFVTITGVNIPELIRISVAVLESHADNKYKLIHQGEPQVIPSLDSRRPFKLNFIIALTNCSKDVNLEKNPFQCYLNPNIPSRNCRAFIWLKAESKYISNVEAHCTPIGRFRRSALDPENVTLDYSEIQSMVRSALEQLEMQSLHRYKQRVLQINSHSTRITSGKVTTIDFDVGYTSCLKYEWVANITSCNFLEHLPRRRCVAQIWERLWINNGKNIDVNCVDDETPLESHIEFESAEMANELARQALKHIEAKYPHPSKQKVVRIFSLEKQVVAGIHYKMKVEIGYTDCLALSDQKDCKLVKNHGLNKFCRVNVWIRPWTDHPPNFRVICDFQEGATRDLYHHVQAEHLFYNFLTTYSPSYVNEYSQMHKRFEIFKNNIKKIHELNVHEKGTAVYGVTRFTDLTYEEFSSTYMGLKKNLTNENQVPMKQADIPNIKVPESFDWRDYDAVTEVKDQGSCGSCWAFSVTGNIEGQWKMQSGQLVSLSEQELVDCDKLDNGCNGGLPDNAYRAIEQMGGLELESDYPYEGTDDKCVFNKTLAKVKISSAVNITSNETGMAQWLVHNGPISIGINANAMQFYMGGISHPWRMLCHPTFIDHGVLIVGYGVKDYPLFHKKLPYWIIKNSWGKSWGEQGYYRVYRGDGTCGLNTMASSAVI
ncbi:hypothetical protein PYW07_008108 [Mythimna separata]|uniref:Cysteine proteinase inhibitor n=1 Tax=Mythimna separata TaxID=271217 RepID=A0AAD8DVJ8_MYTSE|nr:hypothetical protein PYW07_008108 [Mythimna separata]